MDLYHRELDDFESAVTACLAAGVSETLLRAITEQALEGKPGVSSPEEIDEETAPSEDDYDTEDEDDATQSDLDFIMEEESLLDGTVLSGKSSQPPMSTSPSPVSGRQGPTKRIVLRLILRDGPVDTDTSKRNKAASTTKSGATSGKTKASQKVK